MLSGGYERDQTADDVINNDLHVAIISTMT